MFNLMKASHIIVHYIFVRPIYWHYIFILHVAFIKIIFKKVIH